MKSKIRDVALIGERMFTMKSSKVDISKGMAMILTIKSNRRDVAPRGGKEGRQRSSL